MLNAVNLQAIGSCSCLMLYSSSSIQHTHTMVRHQHYCQITRISHKTNGLFAVENLHQYLWVHGMLARAHTKHMWDDHALIIVERCAKTVVDVVDAVLCWPSAIVFLHKTKPSLRRAFWPSASHSFLGAEFMCGLLAIVITKTMMICSESVDPAWCLRGMPGVEVWVSKSDIGRWSIDWLWYTRGGGVRFDRESIENCISKGNWLLTN